MRQQLDTHRRKKNTCVLLVLFTGLGTLTLLGGRSSSRSCGVPVKKAVSFVNLQKSNIALFKRSWVHTSSCRMELKSISEGIELPQHLELLWNSSPLDLTSSLLHWVESHAVLPDLSPIPPAYAEVAPLKASPLEAPDWRNPVLDPNVRYLYGADGKVIIDLMSKRPLEDNWWNQACGFQAGLVRIVDQQLRNLGVPQAFGWTILLYTLLIKALTFPLERPGLRNAAVTKMLSGKLDEIKERYKGNDQVISDRTFKVMEMFDAGIAGGCLPALLQIPIIWTLFFCWRRLAAEGFEHYGEPWLWIPSLGQPNPNFDYKLDWLLEFNGSQPKIGLDIWLRQLVLPVVLVCTNIYQSWANQKKDEGVSWISVFSVLLIAWISLELPQAISVYYLATYGTRFAEEELVKSQLRKEIPAFEVYEATGRFPEGNFEDVLFPNLHLCAKTGNMTQFSDRIGEGCDVNELDEHHVAPIAYAVANGNMAMVAAFAVAGANIRVLDPEKSTLLHVAAAYDHADIMKYLIAFGEAHPMYGSEFREEKWATWHNSKGLTVVDIARKRPTGKVYEFLRSTLDLDVKEHAEPEEPSPVHSIAHGVSTEPAAAFIKRARAVD